MSRPTPGPWRIEGRHIKAMKDKPICELPSGGICHGKVDDANAELIVRLVNEYFAGRARSKEAAREPRRT